MSHNTITIQTTQVTNYKLRGKHSWADIVIEHPREGAVQVLINSDYGSWAYFWGAVGKDWRIFLAGLDRHYMAGKFGCKEHLDDEKTLKMYRERIIENRKMNRITEQQARDCWDRIAEIIDETHSVEGFQSAVYACDCFNWMYDTGPDYCKMIDPQFNIFYDTFWKQLCSYLIEQCEEKEVA